MRVRARGALFRAPVARNARRALPLSLAREPFHRRRDGGRGALERGRLVVVERAAQPLDAAALDGPELGADGRDEVLVVRDDDQPALELAHRADQRVD